MTPYPATRYRAAAYGRPAAPRGLRPAVTAVLLTLGVTLTAVAVRAALTPATALGAAATVAVALGGAVLTLAAVTRLATRAGAA